MTTYGYGYGTDLGGAWVDPMDNIIFTGLYDPWSEVNPSPGIGESPWSLGDLTAEQVAWGNTTYNPLAGIVSGANDIWGQENIFGHIFASPDIDSLLGASSQGSIDNMLNGLGLGGYGTYTDYGSLISDSYSYYDMGVNVYDQFDSGNAYLNDDFYYDGVMGYAYDVANSASLY